MNSKRKIDEPGECCSPDTRAVVGPLIVPDVCFFCDEKGVESLHLSETEDVGQAVRRAATALSDRKLLAKLANTDMVAQRSKYHTKCLVTPYNREDILARQSFSDKDPYLSLKAIAMAELISYVEDSREPDICPVFHLSDLSKMYTD